MAQGPFTADLPELIALKYRTPVNRWTELPINPSQAQSLQGATAHDPEQSALWPLLSHLGIGDVLSVAFADRWGLWGWLELWRGQGSAEFSAAELHVVELLAGSIAVGLRECSAREFFSGGRSVAAVHPQAIVILGEDLSILSQTESAVPWLTLLQRAPPPHEGVPAEVLNVAAQLLAVECGVATQPARSRLHIGDGVWASLQATRMVAAGTQAGTEAAAMAPIAVTIQDCLPAERIEIFQRCFALSPRECVLLRHTAAGLDTAELAHRMGISRYTVQDLFKSLFEKCGVQSRGALLALALGPMAPEGR